MRSPLPRPKRTHPSASPSDPLAENQQHDAADLHGKVGGSREPAVLALPARDGAILSGMEGLIGDRRTRGPADQ